MAPPRKRKVVWCTAKSKKKEAPAEADAPGD